ncbi:hypothetical protein [Thiobacillus thioparus]|uniref:hypothetical protein n=1 Tax=Thiobacillus thioparus TaxID=931 RepID=UPI0012FA6526|nr:hypothetical protein [Thiobacillus thioparus]
MLNKSVKSVCYGAFLIAPSRFPACGLLAQVSLPLASGLRAAKSPLPDEEAQDPVDEATADPDQSVLSA